MRLPALAFIATLCACVGNNPPSGLPSGAGLGDSCAAQGCRAGLLCDSATMTCLAGFTLADGTPCTTGNECQSGHCRPDGARGRCGQPGDAGVGASCQGDAMCAKGLKCTFDGETLFPACRTAGSRDVGGACAGGRDCAQGLFCVDQKCATQLVPAAAAPDGYPPFVPNPATAWTGVTCPTEKMSGVKALWALPRDSDDAMARQDFFRLPFPNDAVRDAAGAVDFGRFPKDPAPPFGFDALGRYLAVLAKEPFSNYGRVTLRFDGRLDPSTLSGQGLNPQTRIVDLTTGPRFGRGKGFYFFYNSARNRYVCNNWVAVRPAAGDPYLPGTYALLMLKGPKDSAGGEVQPADDFLELLKPTQPSDAALARAWQAYAPLRTYLTQQNIGMGLVLTAAVFTVGDPQRQATALADALEAAPVATTERWVKCAPGAVSPCPDAIGERACGTSAAVDEWHGLLELPIFQRGVAPYLSPDAGGDLDLTGPVRREKVCAALSVPKGASPDGGFPLVVYAHGTGGSFRGHLGDGAAEGLANVTLADGGVVQAAVLGFDQVGHGPRRGARTDVLPQDVVFNFGNPASARGTMAQGAADLHAVFKLLASGADAGWPVPLDTSKVAFWGQSQGATEGGLFLAHDTRAQGAVLSGASASLTHALVTKKAPINLADGLWLALSESAPGAVNEFHPVLSLLQQWTDVVDPVNFGRDVAQVPARAGKPAHAHHVFQPWGKNDLFTASAVQARFAASAKLAFVGPKEDTYEHYGVLPVDAASGNSMGARPVTAVMRQYVPMGYDGHYVAFRDPTAKSDVLRFLGRVLRGETPAMPER